MLDRRLRRRPNIETAFGQRLVFAGDINLVHSPCTHIEHLSPVPTLGLHRDANAEVILYCLYVLLNLDRPATRFKFNYHDN